MPQFKRTKYIYFTFMDQQPKHITCEHLLDLGSRPIDEQEHVVIDLRDETDWEVGHIKDSLHVPHKELQNVEALVPDKKSHVIVVLGPTQQKEIDSTHDRLTAMGYSKVEFLAGGVDRYCEIADVEVKDVLAEEMTPEEAGITADGNEASDVTPEAGDNEPMY